MILMAFYNFNDSMILPRYALEGLFSQAGNWAQFPCYHSHNTEQGEEPARQGVFLYEEIDLFQKYSNKPWFSIGNRSNCGM